MGADIVDDLEALAEKVSGRQMLVATTLRRAAAEIGGLRGEVERQESSHGNTIDQRDRAHEMIDSVYAAVMDAFPEWSSAYGFADALNDIEDRIHTIRTAAPAPAMPNRVEAARVLADFAETAPGRLPGRVQEAIATIRAADNRDAAWVTEEKGDVLLDYVLPCDVAVAPATKISKGVRLRTLLSAIRLRESDGPQFEPGAGFRALFDTPQPAGGEAVAFPEHDGDTCYASDCYAGNSVGWWKSKAENYGAGLLKVCDALRRIGVKLDGATPCWEYVAKLHTTPPAAQVQAAPQEGEVPQLVRYGRGSAESPYLLDQRDDGYWTPWHVAQRELARALAAHPSACELGQRLSDYLCGLAENGVVTLDPFDSNNIDAIVAALQHRGDSQEVDRG